MAGDKDSKTEKPTPKRLAEARKEGRIARSPELVSWSGILIAVWLIQYTVGRGGAFLSKEMNRMAELISAPDANKALHFMADSIKESMLLLLPLMIGFAVISLIGSFAQVRFVLAWKALKPMWSRVNPIEGFKRMLSTQSLWQAAKEVIKVTILSYVAYKTLYQTLIALAENGPYDVSEIIRVVSNAVLVFIRQIAAAGIIIGLLDFLYQRKKINDGLKMTKHEIKEESRSQDVAPEIKSKIRHKQMRMSRNRMMAAVGEADVVIVNPVHIAIALKYDALRGAPKVTAKGAGFVAEKLRDKADEHRVPVVQDILLARALHKACDIDDEIPSALFEAVARVLAFVYGLRARGTSDGFHKMPGTPELEDADRLELVDAAPRM